MDDDLDMIRWIHVFCRLIGNKMSIDSVFLTRFQISYSSIRGRLGWAIATDKKLLHIGRDTQPFALNIPYIVLNVYDKSISNQVFGILFGFS